MNNLPEKTMSFSGIFLEVFVYYMVVFVCTGELSMIIKMRTGVIYVFLFGLGMFFVSCDSSDKKEDTRDTPTKGQILN